MLTAESDNALHCISICHGAMGIILMNESVETLIKAIHKVHAGEMWIERSMTASVIAEMRSKRNLQSIEGKMSRDNALTAREREIISLIAEGLNNQQIADHLYLSKATVRHHITSIFSKLEVSDRIGLLIYSYRHGLVEPPRRANRSA
jgi:DNA-binding NarL/FixJ family response regulator